MKHIPTNVNEVDVGIYQIIKNIILTSFSVTEVIDRGCEESRRSQLRDLSLRISVIEDFVALKN